VQNRFKKYLTHIKSYQKKTRTADTLQDDGGGLSDCSDSPTHSGKRKADEMLRSTPRAKRLRAADDKLPDTHKLKEMSQSMGPSLPQQVVSAAPPQPTDGIASLHHLQPQQPLQLSSSQPQPSSTMSLGPVTVVPRMDSRNIMK
jgi:hypothetical protein